MNEEEYSAVYDGWDVFCTFSLTFLIAISIGFAMGVYTERSGHEDKKVWQNLNMEPDQQLVANPFQ